MTQAFHTDYSHFTWTTSGRYISCCKPWMLRFWTTCEFRKFATSSGGSQSRQPEHWHISNACGNPVLPDPYVQNWDLITSFDLCVVRHGERLLHGHVQIEGRLWSDCVTWYRHDFSDDPILKVHPVCLYACPRVQSCSLQNLRFVATLVTLTNQPFGRKIAHSKNLG